MIYLINYQDLVIVVFQLLNFYYGSMIVSCFLTAKPNLHTIIYWYQSHIYATVPPSVVVYEPAPHAGARTECE